MLRWTHKLPSSSYSSLVLTPLLMSKESEERMVYLFNKVLSSIYPWDKVKKTSPSRHYIMLVNMDIGLCFKTYISCRVGWRSLREILKLFVKMCILTSDVSCPLNHPHYQKWKPSLSQSCKTQLRLLMSHLRILRLTLEEPSLNLMSHISRKLVVINSKNSRHYCSVSVCSIP